jgi:predicted ATP-dependent serine protease
MADMDLHLGIAGFKNGTNIMEMSVPAHLKRRVQTGLSWFDDALGGQGACPSAVYMMTGVSGGGKTTAMLQLADAVTGTGNVCLYNSGEESLHQVRMTCGRLNMKHGFIAGQEVFTNPKDDAGKPKNKDCKGHEGLLPYAERMYNTHCKGQKDHNGSPKTLFLVCDSLQSLNDGKYGYDSNGPTTDRVVKDLTSWAKRMKNVVVIFIGQVGKDGTFKGSNMIKHAVDGHLHICFDADKKSEMFGARMFLTLKNRFGHAGQGMYFDLESDGLRTIGPVGGTFAA